MRIAIVLTSALLMAACASTGRTGNKAGHVQVMSSGLIRVNGRQVAVDQVGPALRARGYGQRSPINIHITEDASPKIMKMLTVSLTRSGFTRVMFIKPRQTYSDTKTGPALR